MFLIPGSLIAYLTFPGIIAHEIAHKFFCDIARVPVYKVCYFQWRAPYGYVIHGATEVLGKSFLIAVGPLIVNTILCALLTFPAVYPSFMLSVTDFNPIFLLLMWIGISIGMHAFPSNQDMEELLSIIESSDQPIYIFLSVKIFSGLVKVANFFRFAWIDTLYAIGVSMALPYLTTLF